MGLDTVELVMAVEDEFDIAISPSAAEKITTVGELRDFVVWALESKMDDAAPVDPEAVLKRIQRIFETNHGLGPEQVVPAARIIDDLGLD